MWRLPRVRGFVGCLTFQQHASAFQGRICSDNFTCCHTEIQVADQTFHLRKSQYTDIRPTSPSTDPIPPGAWQFLSHWNGLTPEKSRCQRDSNPGSSALEADAVTTRPTRWLSTGDLEISTPVATVRDACVQGSGSTKTQCDYLYGWI